MHFNRLGLFLLIMVVLGFASIPLQAQTQFDVEQVLPDKTLLLMTLPTDEKFWDEMTTTGIWQFFTAAEWQSCFNSLPPNMLAGIQGQIQQVEQMLGIPFADLVKTFRGQKSVAIVGLAEGPMPIPIILATWNLGEQKQAFAGLFDKIRPSLLQAQRIKEDTIDIGGQQVLMLTIPRIPVPIFIAYADNTLVICTDRNYLESVLVAAKRPAQTLNNFATYTNVKSQLLQNRSGAMLYCNVQQIFTTARALQPQQMQQVEPILQLSGLGSIEAIGAAFSTRNQAVVETIYVYTPNGRSGVLGGLLLPAQAPEQLLSSIPEKVLGVSHGFIDLAGLYQTVTDLMSKLAPREYQQFVAVKQQMEQKLGVNLEKDVLASLGNEYLFTVSCSGGLLPDVGFQLALKDCSKFQGLLQRVLAMVPKKYHYQVTWNNHTFTYFNFSTASQPIPVAPTIAIENDRILFSLFPESAKNLLGQTKGQLPADLKTCMGERKYTMAEHWNIRALAGPVYRTAVPLIQAMVPREKLPFEPALLPSADLLEKNLANLSTLAFHDTQGLLWEIHSPAGTMLFSLAGGVANALMQKQHRAHRNWQPEQIEKPRDLTPDQSEPQQVTPEDEKQSSVQDGQTSPVAEDALPSTLVAIEEKRNWKLNEPDLKSVLQNVWVSNSKMDVKLFIPLPKNAVALGAFRFTQGVDDKGKSIVPAGTQLASMKKFYPHELENIAKGQGFVANLELPAPSREAGMFSLRGEFIVKLAGELLEVSIPDYGKCKAEQREITEIPDLQIRFHKGSPSSISLKVKGDICKIANVLVLKNGKTEAPSSTSSYNGYGADENTIFLSYYYRGNIPDDAAVVIQYLKTVEDRNGTITVENQKLP